MTTKILLAKPETDERPLFAPLGIMYIASALEKSGYHTEIWHDREKNLQKLYQKAEELQPEWIGFSTHTMPNLKGIIKASKHLHPNHTIVWGGVHATIMPEKCAEEEYVDYVITREGEETAVKLTRALTKGNGKTIPQIPGTVYQQNEETINNGYSPFIQNLDKYEPLWNKVDAEKYLIKTEWGNRVAPLVTSRGCPFECGFCFSPKVYKRTWRHHSKEYITNHVEKLKDNYNIDGLSIRDENFFAKRKIAKETIKEFNIPFYAPIRADTLLDKKFAKWLDQKNCKQVYIGAESGSERVLEVMSKHIKPETIEKAVQNLNDTEIEPFLGFIIGTPGETEKEQKETLQFIDKLYKINPKVNIGLNCYTPYPKTSLWHKALKHGLKEPENNEQWAIDRVDSAKMLPWIDLDKYLAMHYSLKYTKKVATPKGIKKLGYHLIKPLMALRWKTKRFGIPIEMKILRKIKGEKDTIME